MTGRFPPKSPYKGKTSLFREALSISGLLLSLFVRRMTPTPFAILLELDLAGDKLAIFA